MPKIVIVGFGGGGGKVAENVAKIAPDDVLVVDGDTFEAHNLERQFVPEKYIGVNKAEAAADIYNWRWEFMPEFFHSGLDLGIDAGTTIFCCADNFPARKECLITADRAGCTVIIGGNSEGMDAEAYYYEPRMRGTPNDPRIYYPVILTNTGNDPLMPGGCQGDEAMKKGGQLVLANYLSAAFMLMLYWWWEKVMPTKDRATRDSWPVHHNFTEWGCQRTIAWGDRLKEEK